MAEPSEVSLEKRFLNLRTLLSFALALGVHPSPFLLLFAAQAIALLIAIPFTPACLGVVEAGVAGCS